MLLEKSLEGRVNQTFLGVFRLPWTSCQSLTVNLRRQHLTDNLFGDKNVTHLNLEGKIHQI